VERLEGLVAHHQDEVDGCTGGGLSEDVERGEIQGLGQGVLSQAVGDDLGGELFQVELGLLGPLKGAVLGAGLVQAT